MCRLPVLVATVVAFFATVKTEHQGQFVRATVVFLELLEREVIAIVQLENVHVGAEQDACGAACTTPDTEPSDKLVVDERAEHVEVNLEGPVLDIVNQDGRLQLEIVRLYLELVAKGDDGIFEERTFVLARLDFADFGNDEVWEGHTHESALFKGCESTQGSIENLVSVHGIHDDLVWLLTQERVVKHRICQFFCQKLRRKTGSELDVFQLVSKGVIELQTGIGHVAEVLVHDPQPDSKRLADWAVVAYAVAFRRTWEPRPLTAKAHENLVVFVKTSYSWGDEDWVDGIVGKNRGLLLRPSRLEGKSSEYE